MRILTVIYDLKAGGTQRAARNFSVAYRNAGLDVAVFAIHGSGVFHQDLVGHGIPVFIGGDKLNEALMDAKAWSPDIIHIHRWGNADPLTSRILNELKGVRTKVAETNVFSLVDTSKQRSLIDVHFHLSRWCFWRWWQQAKLLKPAPQACVIPYAVDCDSFFPESLDKRTAFRAEHGIPQDAFLFGRVGQPALGKWHRGLLTAFQEVASRNEKAHLCLAGTPPEMRAEILKMPTQVQSRAHDLPSRVGDESLRIFYSSLDAFIHWAEIGESFGMVLAEAMLCTCPVITMSTPRADNSQLEVVGHGRGGIVVAHPRNLPEAMLHLMLNSDLRVSFSRAGPDLIRKRYGLEAVAPWALKVFEALLKNQSLDEITGLQTSITDDEIRSLFHEALGKYSLRDSIAVLHPRLYSILRTYFGRKPSAR